MRMGPHMMLPSDRESVKGVRISRGGLRRVWVFAKPYRRSIYGFLGTIVAAAVLSLVAPFAFRRIIDHAIPNGDRREITWLAGFVVLAAILDAGLAIVQRWYSARIGEGLIYDLRIALVRQGAADADRVLHPDADRQRDQPAEQRRRRRAVRSHQHARQRRQQRRRPRHHAGRDDRRSSGA